MWRFCKSLPAFTISSSCIPPSGYYNRSATWTIITLNIGDFSMYGKNCRSWERKSRPFTSDELVSRGQASLWQQTQFSRPTIPLLYTLPLQSLYVLFRSYSIHTSLESTIRSHRVPVKHTSALLNHDNNTPATALATTQDSLWGSEHSCTEPVPGVAGTENFRFQRCLLIVIRPAEV
jgi:hypothetical protein